MTKEEFENKVHLFRPRLIEYALSMIKNMDEAEDVVQDVFLKLWFYKENTDCYKSFEAVAFTIAKRLIFNKNRDRKTFLPLSELSGILEENTIENLELSDELLLAIESLPSVEQAVMRMKHLEDMETEEIAMLTGSNANAIRVALSRARKKLRDRFVTDK